MSLVTAVIMSFIYIAIYTNLIFVENSYKYSYGRIWLLYFTVLRYLKNWTV